MLQYSLKGFIMKRKLISKATDNGITFVFSTSDVDRDGDRVLQDWDLADFKKNPIALAFHRHDQPIGVWENIRVEAGKLLGDLKLAARGTSDFIDTLHGLVEQGILKAVSVGFRSSEHKPNDYGGYDLSKNYLFECSLVTVPANQNALRKAFDFLPEDELDSLCSVSGSCGCNATEGITTTKRVSDSSTNKNLNEKGHVMTIAERIKKLEGELLAAKDGLTALTQAEQVDNDAIEAATATIKQLEGSLETFKNAEKALAVKSDAVVETSKGTTTVTSVKKAREKGQLATMAFAAIAKAHVLNVNPVDAAKGMYGDTEDVNIMVKAASAPADVGTAGWASELVREGYGEFMELLMPKTIYGRIPGLTLEFDKSGSIIIPGTASSRDVAGGFVAEGAPIPVKQGAFTSNTLTPKKMAVITTFTKEILRKSTPSIEALLRNAIIKDTTKAIDAAFVDNVAGSTLRPAGMQNATSTGAANIVASTGVTVAAILADVLGVQTRASAVELGESGVWVMNPARVFSLGTKQLTTGALAFPEVKDGYFMGYPIVISTTQPAAVVMFIDSDSLIKANDLAPEFSTSDQATLVMDTAADALSDGGALQAGVTELPVRSLYQTDAVALKFTLGLDWSVQRQGGVQVLTGVAW